MIFLQIWWTLFFLSNTGPEAKTAREASSELQEFRDDYLKAQGDLEDIHKAYDELRGTMHAEDLIRNRRGAIRNVLAQFEQDANEEDRALKGAADQWYRQFLSRQARRMKKRRVSHMKRFKDFDDDLADTELGKVKKKYKDMPIDSINMRTDKDYGNELKGSSPLDIKLKHLHNILFENENENVAKIDEVQGAGDYDGGRVPDNAFEQAISRLHSSSLGNSRQGSSYELTNNNLSHEADYKLSKNEQEASEPVRKQSRWPFGQASLEQQQSEVHKRHSGFNAMNEIKLKTSSRLMSKGYGPSLPSNSLEETRHEMAVDDLIKRKEKSLEQQEQQKNKEDDYGMEYGDYDGTIVQLNDQAEGDNVGGEYLPNYHLSQYSGDKAVHNANGYMKYYDAGNRFKRLSNTKTVAKATHGKNAETSKVASGIKLAESNIKQSEQQPKVTKLQAVAELVAVSKANAGAVPPSKLDGNDASKTAAAMAAGTKTANDAKLESSEIKTNAADNTIGSMSAESETKLSAAAIGDAEKSKGGGMAKLLANDLAVQQVTSGSGVAANAAVGNAETDSNKDRAKRFTKGHVIGHQFQRYAQFAAPRSRVHRNKRFVQTDAEQFQNSRDFDTFERNEDEQRMLRVRRAIPVQKSQLRQRRSLARSKLSNNCTQHSNHSNHSIVKRQSLSDGVMVEDGNSVKNAIVKDTLSLDDSFELANAVADIKSARNAVITIAKKPTNRLNMEQFDKMRGRQIVNNNNNNNSNQKQQNENNTLSYNSYLNSLTTLNTHALGNVNTNTNAINQNQNHNQNNPMNTYQVLEPQQQQQLAQQQAQQQQAQQQQAQQQRPQQQQSQAQPQSQLQLQQAYQAQQQTANMEQLQKQFPECVPILPNIPIPIRPQTPTPTAQAAPTAQPAPTAQAAPLNISAGNAVDLTKLNIKINANICRDQKAKRYFGNGSINVQEGLREDRVTREVWDPFEVDEDFIPIDDDDILDDTLDLGTDEKRAIKADNKMVSMQDVKAPFLDETNEKKNGKKQNIKMNVNKSNLEFAAKNGKTTNKPATTTNKPEQKANSNNNNNGAIGTIPTTRIDTTTTTPITTTTIQTQTQKQQDIGDDNNKKKIDADIEPDSSDDDSYSTMYDRMIKGKLSIDIVDQVLNTISKDPEMAPLYAELQRNRCCMKRKYKQSQDLVTAAKQNNCSDQASQQTQKMLQRFMDTINAIIDKQVRQRTCISLPPALKEFYEIILATHAQQDKSRAKREYELRGLADEFSQDLRSIDANKIEQKSRIVKKLLRQYEELPEADQLAALNIRDELLLDLIFLHRMQDGLEREHRSSKKEEILETPCCNSKEKFSSFGGVTYTKDFTKLIKVAETFNKVQAIADFGDIGLEDY